MGMRKAVTLASNGSAGNGSAVEVESGKYMMTASATWGGGSIKLQILSKDGSTYVDIASSTLSANGTLNIDLPKGAVRAVIATASAVYAELLPIDQR